MIVGLSWRFDRGCGLWREVVNRLEADAKQHGSQQGHGNQYVSVFNMDVTQVPRPIGPYFSILD